MPIVVALLRDTTQQARIEHVVRILNGRGSRYRCQLRLVTGWTALTKAASEGVPLLAVVNPFEVGLAPTAVSDNMAMSAQVMMPLRHWFRSTPRTITAVYAREFELSPRTVLELAEAGVADIVTQDVDDEPKPLSKRLLRLIEEKLCADIVGAVPLGVSAEVRDLVAKITVEAHRNLSPSEMAKWIHGDRATLYRKLKRCGLPPPRELIDRIHIYQVLRYVQAHECTIERGALEFGYRSASTLSQQVSRLVGCTPRELVSHFKADALRDRILALPWGPPGV